MGEIEKPTVDRRSAPIHPKAMPEVTPVLVAAARLQVTINDRLGVPTDPMIRELAEGRG